MKRSTVNRLIAEAMEFMRDQCFSLPPFAFFSFEDWLKCGDEYREIADNLLGWDVTDFGSGDFFREGLMLFTVRNGNAADPKKYPKPYAEKIMVVRDGQVTPYHFHHRKMEDIINRGGGTLVIRLYGANSRDELDEVSPVEAFVDGRRYAVRAGQEIRLAPGQSITLMPRQYHSFWGEGMCLVGEVSGVNDDEKDNRFLKEQARFPPIEEDEQARFLLAKDVVALFC